MQVLFVVAVIIISLSPLAVAYPWQICGNTGNYTANSTYQANLNAISTALPTNASNSPSLFATAFVGSVPNQVFALGLCRGDQNASSCLTCLTVAFQDAQNLCPYNKAVTIYYDPCYLSFSNANFLSLTSNLNELILYNVNNVTILTSQFNTLTGDVVNATAGYAADETARRFGTGITDFDLQYPKIYSLAQCTPDLSSAQCEGCLKRIVSLMPQYFDAKQGARILGVRCNYRYEVYPFYNGQALLQLPPTTLAAAPVKALKPNGGGKSNVIAVVLGIILPVAAALLAIALFFHCRSRKASVPYAADPEEIQSVQSLLLDLPTLRTAKADFAESNLVKEDLVQSTREFPPVELR